MRTNRRSSTARSPLKRVGVNGLHKRNEIAKLLRQNSQLMFHGRVCHPEPVQIARMIRSLQQVLLPNYFQPEASDAPPCIDTLWQSMAGQIHRALFQKCMDKDSTAETRSKAEDLAHEVITQLPMVQEMLYEDVVETYHSDPSASGYDEIILTYPGLYALMVYRLAHVVLDIGIPLLPRMMTEYAHRETGIDLHPGSAIGRGIMIDHGTGIVVGETAVVGDHVKFYQGVTLGALYFPRDENGAMVRATKRHPTVEDNVVLYSNATVLGGDTVIGHHSAIGSNTWVTSSVPPYSKVVYDTESKIKTRVGK